MSTNTKRFTPLVVLYLLLATLYFVGGCAPAEGRAGVNGGGEGEAAVAAMTTSVHGHAAAAEAAGHHAGHDAAGEPLGEPSDFSIYNLSSEWVDQTGEARTLESLAGRVQVVAMVYTSCAFACPRILMDMKRIEGEIAREHGDDAGFVLVSIDPERDTPEKLRDYASGARLDAERWTLLHGGDGDVLELAAVLGVQYRETEEGEFSHSNVLTVLDQRGEIVHRQVGLGADPTETVQVIRGLLAES